MSAHKLRYFNDDPGVGDISDRSGDEQGDAILFLHNRPTWDEVAQFMARSGIPSLDVKQVTIYELSDNSRLQVLGVFGKLQAEANLAEQAGDSKLLQHLLRWQIPQTNLSRTGVSQAVELHNPADAPPPEIPQLFWPLQVPLRLRGVLQVQFTDVEISSPAEDEVAESASILALLLDLVALHDESGNDGDLPLPCCPWSSRRGRRRKTTWTPQSSRANGRYCYPERSAEPRYSAPRFHRHLRPELH